eukprot:TRINITY_DN115168_c0_g1_i1.p1 TRINITY_DN115168_c0_g1~~TRINITY_DN115168_c0_g1_i1.p1  ORF type:complete len:173 (-),score=47.91 TRINITY_DN115168_c0_g1_i1:146-664(-)
MQRCRCGPMGQTLVAALALALLSSCAEGVALKSKMPVAAKRLPAPAVTAKAAAPAAAKVSAPAVPSPPSAASTAALPTSAGQQGEDRRSLVLYNIVIVMVICGIFAYWRFFLHRYNAKGQLTLQEASLDKGTFFEHLQPQPFEAHPESWGCKAGAFNAPMTDAFGLGTVTIH